MSNKEAKPSKADQIAALRARRHDEAKRKAGAAAALQDPKASVEAPSPKAKPLRQKKRRKE